MTMKCYYVDDTIFQQTKFQTEMYHRFLSLLRRNRVSLILISKVHKDNEILQEFLHTYKNIPIIMSNRLFDVEGIKGQVTHSHVIIDDFPVMESYSGSCVEYDLKKKSCRRIYLDMFSSHHYESSFSFLKDEIEQILKEVMEEEGRKLSLN